MVLRESIPGSQVIRGVECDQKRYLKVTDKGRVPKVTREWLVEEKPGYDRYAVVPFFFMLGMWFLFWIILQPLGYWFFEISMVVMLWVWLDILKKQMKD